MRIFECWRRNFINIQQSHRIQIDGAQALPIRTGYELMMAHRVDSMFASTSKGPGTIIEKKKNYVVIKYDDPNLGEERIKLGREFGVVTGHVVPHEIVCDLEVGTKFDKDTVIAYHPKFFVRDWRNPSQVVAMGGYVANIALMENNETFEDSSLISRKLSQKLKTTVSHTRTITANFDQAIRNLVDVGQELDTDDILAYIEDSVSANFDFFDEASTEALRRLGQPAPRAKFLGKVEKVEVFYFGDREDMSDSIRKIADKYDARRAREAKELGVFTATTGEVFAPSRIDGLSLELDMIAIRIYITHGRGMGSGDKIVVGNQKKSVVSAVFDGELRTEGPVFKGGQPWDIDLQFSYRAINARIVNSAILFGMSSILVQNIESEMLKAYDS